GRMKRYCVSQIGSNVIYVFSSQDQADRHVRQLTGDQKSRWWSVQPKDEHPLPVNGHAVLSFPQASRA
ncbi:MAG TPA: hypothetical protein VER98_08425, partial [Terriglobia bacterium]|nr:hypothetical protein [Terriglobia bacterium]